MANVIRWGRKYRSEGTGTPDGMEFTEVFLCEFDEPPDDPLVDVMAYSECPTFFAAHKTVTGLFCVGIDPVQVEDAPQVFEVRIRWADRYERDGETLQFGPGTGELENPLLIPAQIEYGSYTVREEFKSAYNEQDKWAPVITSAGEPIYLEDEVEYPVISIQKNVAAVNPIFAKERRFINSDTVRINGISYAPDTLLLRNLRLGPFKIWKPTALKGAVRVGYWPLSFQLFYRPIIGQGGAILNGWKRKLYNAGFICYHELGGRMTAITVGSPPQFPQNPIPLTDDGKVPAIFRQQQGDQLISQEELDKVWKAAERFWRTVERIRFTGNLPFK